MVMFRPVVRSGLKWGDRAREVFLKRLMFCILAIAAFILITAQESYCDAGAATALVRTKITRELTQKELVEQGIDILHVYRDGRADLAVTDEQLAWLVSKRAAVSILEWAASAIALDLDQNLGEYHTYAEMETELNALAAAYPSLTHIDTMGTSIEGRVIRAIKISDNAAINESEPEVFIMGNNHARELMSVEVPLLLAKYLLENYGIKASVTSLVNEREIWIAPMINPDGHVYVELNHAGASYNWWRKNRRLNAGGSYGVDLNRNYGYMWGYDNVGSSPTPSSAVYRGTAPFSEPETQAVRDFCAQHSFVIDLSYHSYGELILYPWGYAPVFTGEQELYVALGDSLKRGNNYLAGNTATGAIYLTNGGSDDWAYGDTQTKNKIYSFTVELNSLAEGGFSPPESLIQPTFAKVLDLNLALIRFADNPYRVLGPWAPIMNEIATLNPPNYEISWTGSQPADPNPALSYELTEIKNLTMVTDSCELGDALWTPGGFVLTSARAAVGSYSFYSGRGDGLNQTLAMTNIVPMWFNQTLTCRLWYDIEQNWDYAYLEGSTDQGATWITVPGNRTTNYNPNGTNRGNGITGVSGGWVAATFDLRNLFVSETGFILLRFSYITDSAVNNEGIYIDLVEPTSRPDRSTVLASNGPNTWFHRWPSELGTFVYYVRAFDAEGHAGKRSDLAVQLVDDLSAATLPALRTGLAQNFPNPFNPSTSIAFSVGDEDTRGARTAPVSLSIYDVAGRRVAALVERDMAPGTYSFVWDGLGVNGKPLASGVYFARLTVRNRAFTEKMVLLK
jgi:hypothetical protein